MPGASTIEVHLYDGSLQQLPAGQDFLITTRGGGNARFQSAFFSENPARIPVIVRDDGTDGYTVLATLKRYEDAGFMPLNVESGQVHSVHLMLLSRNAVFDFTPATWTILQSERPALVRFLSSDAAPDANYKTLVEEQQTCLACLLNLCTAIENIGLLGNLKSIDLRRIGDQNNREGVKPDRFYAYADPALISKLVEMKKAGLFEGASPALHGPEATQSFKEIRFDEANLEFTFHEKAPRRRIGDLDCVKVEVDIDFYKDQGTHFFLEVIPNLVTRKLRIGPGLTDPRMVYALRWMAGKNAGEDFDPLYRIV